MRYSAVVLLWRQAAARRVAGLEKGTWMEYLRVVERNAASEGRVVARSHLPPVSTDAVAPAAHERWNQRLRAQPVDLLKRTLRSTLRHTPYEVRRRDEALGSDERVQNVRRAYANISMLSAAGLEMLYTQAAHCERAGLSGAFVECGVWHGGSAAVMAHANLDEGEARRRLHLFDSFVGIPEPDASVDGARAVEWVGGVTRARGRLRVALDYRDRGGPGSEATVREVLSSAGYPDEYVAVHVGWFQETVPAAAATVGPIALLHLDGDWYASTKICLEHLYKSVVRGGFIVVNDYGLNEGCRKAVDEFLAQLQPIPFLAKVDAEIRYWIKCDGGTTTDSTDAEPP